MLSALKILETQWWLFLLYGSATQQKRIYKFADPKAEILRTSCHPTQLDAVFLLFMITKED